MFAKGMSIVLTIILGVLALFTLSVVLAFFFAILKKIVWPDGFFNDWFSAIKPIFRYLLFGAVIALAFMLLVYLVGAITSLNMETVKNVGVVVGVIGGIVAVITGIVKLFERKPK